jgi:hypothetical protein
VSEPPAAREVVTATPRRTGERRAWPASEDLYRRDEAAGVLLRSLLRAQLGVTISVLVPAVVVVGLYPVLASAFPVIATADIGAVPLTLVVLGGGLYPPMVLLGFWYVRRAAKVEQRFTELLDER